MSFLSNLFGSNNDANLKAIINNGAFLVDVREPGEYASGSVKGAVNIPLGSVSSQLSTFKNKNNIIVFCKSGGRSSQAKAILEANNITNVVNGGAWQNIAPLAK